MVPKISLNVDVMGCLYFLTIATIRVSSTLLSPLRSGGPSHEHSDVRNRSVNRWKALNVEWNVRHICLCFIVGYMNGIHIHTICSQIK